MAGMLSGIMGSGGAAGAAGATGAAPQGGMKVGDYGSSWGGGFANGRPTGGYDDMMASKSPYDVPSPAQPSGIGGEEAGNQGLLEMLGQYQGARWGGENIAPPQSNSAFIGMPGLMAMGNRHQARNQNARQAYRNGLLGG